MIFFPKWSLYTWETIVFALLNLYMKPERLLDHWGKMFPIFRVRKVCNVPQLSRSCNDVFSKLLQSGVSPAELYDTVCKQVLFCCSSCCQSFIYDSNYKIWVQTLKTVIPMLHKSILLFLSLVLVCLLKFVQCRALKLFLLHTPLKSTGEPCSTNILEWL